MPMPNPRAAGFSLLELMVTVAIAAILLSLGLPSFQSTLRSNRVVTATNEIIASLALARTEAIRSTRSAGVCPSTTGTACDGTSWNEGWMVWADQGNTGWGDFAAGDTVLRYSSQRPGVTINADDVGNDDIEKFTFDARGRLSSGTTAATIHLSSESCPEGQALLRTLTIGVTGQVRAERGNCS